MTILWRPDPGEADMTSRRRPLATLRWLYTPKAVDERLKVLGWRRHTAWKRTADGMEASARKIR